MEAKYDLFTKVSDRRDIVDFVKEIEKYPCLYNKTLPEYANKVHNRRAWSTIAKKINTTVPDCRDKWRKIRISFMRSLKQQQSDKPPMRPYYLADDLQFLRPFLTINSKSPSHKKEEQMDYQSTIQKQENSDSDSSDPSFDIEIAEDEPEIIKPTFKETSSIVEKPKQNIVYIRQNSKYNYSDEKQYANNSYREEKPYGRNSYGDEKQNGRSINGYGDEKQNGRSINGYGDEKQNGRNINGYGDEKQNGRNINGYGDEKQNGRSINGYGDEKQNGRNIIGYGDEKQHARSINGYSDEKQHGRSIYSDDIEANPRKMFLLSLLPDVECFSESEMRAFRRDVIGVCDNILNKRMIRN